MVTSARANYQSGIQALRHNDDASAEKAFRAALEEEPTMADAYFQLGQIATARGFEPESAWFFSRTIGLDPDHDGARKGLAKLAAPNVTAGVAPDKPMNDLYLPRSQNELDDYVGRYTEKKRAQYTANWTAIPRSVRIAFIAFAAFVVLGCVGVALTIALHH